MNGAVLGHTTKGTARKDGMQALQLHGSSRWEVPPAFCTCCERIQPFPLQTAPR